MTNVSSPGWNAPVFLGSRQDATLELLRAAARKHPSRTWHEAPRMRELGSWPGTSHRTLKRLRALGVIALQSTRGRYGGVRFTFGVRRWLFRPPNRRGLAQMKVQRIDEAMRETFRKLLPRWERGELIQRPGQRDPLARPTPAGSPREPREAGTSRAAGPSPFDLAMAAAGYVRP